MSGLTLKQRRHMVEIEREAIKNLLNDQRKIRAAIKQCRLNITMHQEVLADERTLRLAKRNEKRFAKIAAMEAKLAALKAAA